MNIRDYYAGENEKPLDRMPADGGFAGIFRRIVCIGDSLSSGEFEAADADGNRSYHDKFEYSWGQFLGRLIGSQVYNFSRGGMTTFEYCKTFAEERGFWDPEIKADCYIIALGVNDLCGWNYAVGEIGDMRTGDWQNNPDTFAGWYGRIISKYREISPDAHFFHITMPRHGGDDIYNAHAADQAELLRMIPERFTHNHVVDLNRYGPVYDAEFMKNFFLYGHMNPAGYLLTSRMVASYMDYIIRHDPVLFAQAGMLNTPYYRYDIE